MNSKLSSQSDCNESEDVNGRNSWQGVDHDFSSTNLPQSSTANHFDPSTSIHPLMDPTIIDPQLWNPYIPPIQEIEYISDLLFSPATTDESSIGHYQEQPQWHPLPHFEPMPVSDVSALSFAIPTILHEDSVSPLEEPIVNIFNIPDAGLLPLNDISFEEAAATTVDHLHLDSQGDQVEFEPLVQTNQSQRLTLRPVDNKNAIIHLPISEQSVVIKSKSRSRKQNNPRGVSRRKPKGQEVDQRRACWRCKRYKKPCTGKGSICDTCVTSGFRIWPSALGCRRGNLESFIDIILPAAAESTLRKMDTSYMKPFAWRHGLRLKPSDVLVPPEAADGDAWDQLKFRVQSTEIQGPGVIELIDIAARHQRRKGKRDAILNSTLQATSLTVDFYHTLVSTGEQKMYDPSSQFSELFKKTRKASLTALDIFLRTSLTGRLRDWFPTFCGGVILCFSYILVADAIAAVPSHLRAVAWPDIQKSVIELRHYLYSTAQDLLSVLAKGSRLLDLSCWQLVESDEVGSTKETVKRKRNEEGMRMMDYDEATYDAMRELQEWREQFSFYLKQDSWMTTLPYTVDYLPVATFSRLFQFSKRG